MVITKRHTVVIKINFDDYLNVFKQNNPRLPATLYDDEAETGCKSTCETFIVINEEVTESKDRDLVESGNESFCIKLF